MTRFSSDILLPFPNSNDFNSCGLFQKSGFIGGLGPSNHFQGKWVQNGLPDITLEPHTFNFHKQPLLLPSLFQKFYFIGGLEPSNHFQGNWAKNGLPGIILGPHIEFSQTTPHFVRNVVLHTKLLVSFRNVALLGAWNLVVTTFDTIQRIRPANLCKKK